MTASLRLVPTAFPLCPTGAPLPAGPPRRLFCCRSPVAFFHPTPSSPPPPAHAATVPPPTHTPGGRLPPCVPRPPPPQNCPPWSAPLLPAFSPLLVLRLFHPGLETNLHETYSLLAVWPITPPPPPPLNTDPAPHPPLCRRRRLLLPRKVYPLSVCLLGHRAHCPPAPRDFGLTRAAFWVLPPPLCHPSTCRPPLWA
jgi:hypothetical protein